MLTGARAEARPHPAGFSFLTRFNHARYSCTVFAQAETVHTHAHLSHRGAGPLTPTDEAAPRFPSRSRSFVESHDTPDAPG